MNTQNRAKKNAAQICRKTRNMYGVCKKYFKKFFEWTVGDDHKK